MKRKLLAMALFAAGSAFAQFSIGVQIGAPPPPPRVEVRSAVPGPEFVWVEGYWYPVGNHYKWHRGYWTRAPFAGALWVGPHYEGGHYFEGFWQAGPRHVEHDHHWDRDRRRDFDRDRDHDRGHDRR
jgi:hypothetical protein